MIYSVLSIVNRMSLGNSIIGALLILFLRGGIYKDNIPKIVIRASQCK